MSTPGKLIGVGVQHKNQCLIATRSLFILRTIEHYWPGLQQHIRQFAPPLDRIKVIDRSVGVGGKTSIASVLTAPGRAAVVTSNSNIRYIPIAWSEVATRWPFSQMLAR